MNENKEMTFKEKVQKFTDEYGVVIPAVVVLTVLNTISIACINKTLKIHNKNFDLTATALENFSGKIDSMDSDNSLIKAIIKER